ncbi:MAG: 2-phosphosulfolactate phosphatase [Bacteroidetes bacterium]|nr:MAG: 2-phosphosulfolactate phosphatase [Bacteroidota bacterium]MBL1145256.1 2-phosphosulfolactate phosphatase [Bacteroidota bacterium]NOG58052.1 2-phosphosulfolactate phosphatase [Bacteroidota bacterium]
METIINENQRRIEVCVSPNLFPVYFKNKDCIVVVIDIFRATSAICTAFENGVKGIIPVLTIEEARKYQDTGMLAAAERSGEIVEGFDIGNSPFSYMKPEMKGKEVVLTTTNGTKAINYAKDASEVVIGSFLNLKAICDYLEKKDKDVILLCSGWKDRFNLEDTLFAGAVVYHLKKNERFIGLSDSSIAASCLYDQAKGDLNEFLKNSSHRNRLARLNLEKDIEYCLQENIIELVPILKGNTLKVEV